jgi:hypothetical protein
MVNYISVLVFFVLLLLGGSIVAPLATVNSVLALVIGIVWLVADAILSSIMVQDFRCEPCKRSTVWARRPPIPSCLPCPSS